MTDFKNNLYFPLFCARLNIKDQLESQKRIGSITSRTEGILDALTKSHKIIASRDDYTQYITGLIEGYKEVLEIIEEAEKRWK